MGGRGSALPRPAEPVPLAQSSPSRPTQQRRQLLVLRASPRCLQPPAAVRVVCPDGATPVISSTGTFTCPGSYNTPAICPPGYTAVPGLAGQCVLSTACPAGFQVAPAPLRLPVLLMRPPSGHSRCEAALLLTERLLATPAPQVMAAAGAPWCVQPCPSSGSPPQFIATSTTVYFYCSSSTSGFLDAPLHQTRSQAALAQATSMPSPLLPSLA